MCIMIFHSDPEANKALARLFAAKLDPGIDVICVKSRAEALRKISNSPFHISVFVTELDDATSFDMFIRAMKNASPNTKVVLHANFGDSITGTNVEDVVIRGIPNEDDEMVRRVSLLLRRKAA